MIDMNPTRYIMLRDSTIDPSVKAGDTVYRCMNYDYGLAADDTAMTGVKHISVTLSPTGDYPYFTVPERDVEQIQNVSDLLSLRRIHNMVGLMHPDRPRFYHAVNGIMLQYFAQAAEEGCLRRVPKYENTASQLRKIAVDAFSEAVRAGFVDC